MALTSQITTSLLQVDGRLTEGGVIEIVPGARLLLDVGVEDVEPGALLDEIATAVAEAQAARDEAVDVSGLSTSDAVIANRIETPGTATQTALSATIATVNGGPRPHFLNAYDNFFALGGFATGQSDVATTTTGAASGATVLPIASATGLVVNTVLVVNAGAANASLHKITNIAGTNLTITPALPVAAANGSAVVTLWNSTGHLSTTGGYQAYWRWVLTRTDANGDPIFAPAAGEKVVLLANSWGEQSATIFGNVVAALFPSAVPVNLGVTGNTSAQLLARFDADVPADAAYVIFNEPGVNDATGVTGATTLAQNVDQLVKKIRALDAVPVYTGVVPYAPEARVSAINSDRMKAAAGQWEAKGPGVTLGDVYAAILPPSKIALNGVALGNRAQERATGIDNTAIGDRAQHNLAAATGNTALGSSAQRSATSGNQNTSLGAYAHEDLTTGSNNVAVGHYSQADVTTGGQNVSIGQRSLRLLTSNSNCIGIGHEAGASVTGQNNSHIGSGAGYQPNNNTANATTTAQGQVAIGFQTGQSSTTQADYITAIGYRALAGDANATAIGARASAGHSNAVAIGADTSTSGPNQVAMGARYLELGEMTGEPANPGADKGRLFFIDNGSGKTRLGVKFPSGVTTWLATEA